MGVRKRWFIIISLTLTCGLIFFWSLQEEPVVMPPSWDYDILHEQGGNNNREDDHGSDHDNGEESIALAHHFQAVKNTHYKKRCGACHFAYQPALLPAASWQKILENHQNHFGVELALTARDLTLLATFLTTWAADHAAPIHARRIMRSLQVTPLPLPLRISQLPYIQHVHADLPQALFQRASIGSAANCLACHTTASRGIYAERYIHIPQ